MGLFDTYKKKRSFFGFRSRWYTSVNAKACGLVLFTLPLLFTEISGGLWDFMWDGKSKCALGSSGVLRWWIAFHVLAKARGNSALMAAFIPSSPQSPFPALPAFLAAFDQVFNLSSVLQENQQKQALSFTSGRRYELLLSRLSPQLGPSRGFSKQQRFIVWYCTGNQTVCVFLSLWKGAQSVGGKSGYLLFEVNNTHYIQNDLTGLIIELTAVL